MISPFSISISPSQIFATLSDPILEAEREEEGGDMSTLTKHHSAESIGLLHTRHGAGGGTWAKDFLFYSFPVKVLNVLISNTYTSAFILNSIGASPHPAQKGNLWKYIQVPSCQCLLYQKCQNERERSLALSVMLSTPLPGHPSPHN